MENEAPGAAEPELAGPPARRRTLPRLILLTAAGALVALVWFLGALFVLVNYELEFPVAIEMLILCGWALITLPLAACLAGPLSALRRAVLAVVITILAGMLAAFLFSAFGDVLWQLLPWV